MEAFHFGSIFYYRKEKKEGKELTFAGNKKQGKKGGREKEREAGKKNKEQYVKNEFFS